MSWNRSYAAALTALVLVSCNARADLIGWSYNWEPAAMSLSGDGGSGKVTLTDEPTKNASGNSDTVATNLHVFSSASTGSPDHFTHTAYQLSLTLTDADSHQAGTLRFSGFLAGTISANSSNLTNTFTGILTQQLTLGHHIYTVTIDNYSAPGPPSAVNGGSISAHVSVNLQVDPPPVHQAPEPASLTLAGLGLVGAAWGWGRRKKASTGLPV